jgi:hypothetical protein
MHRKTVYYPNRVENYRTTARAFTDTCAASMITVGRIPLTLR